MFVLFRHYPLAMTELDQVWAEMLIDAEARATTAGRDDIAEYLRLRATNDAIRTTAVSWLLETVIEAASDAMRKFPDLVVERDDGHSFAHGNSTMVGTRLTCRRGLRSMTVEVGWVREPHHGIMRGGALAVARLAHFGMRKAGAELRLVFVEELPVWQINGDNGAFTVDAAVAHVAVLTG